MAKKKALTDKQKVFSEEYIKDLNATKAAERAGYSETSAMNQGHRLINEPHVRSEIQKKMDERSKRTEIDADYVLTTIKDTIERCRQAEPVLDDKGIETGEYKFDATNVLKGCDMLGKHLKLWNGDSHVEVHVNLNEISDEDLDRRIQELESRLK